MTTPAPFVAAPASRGLRYGLLTAANGPLELPDRARSSGVQYEPISCGFARLYPVECPADQQPTPKTFDDDDPLVEAATFVAYASLQCPAVGRTPAQMAEKVTIRLANGEQSVAEQALADVLAGDAVDVFPSDSDSLTDVVASLEAWLYGQDGANYGNVGVLHAPARIQAHAAARGLYRFDGPVMRTGMGTVWSFGGGYPDDGAIYITGSTTVWRAPSIAVPGDGQVFDRATNIRYALAEREYAVAYDCVAGVATYTGDIPQS